MKVPVSWLREYVPDAPPVSEIAARLAVVGTEVERIVHIGVPSNGTRAAQDNGYDPMDAFRIGRVEELEQHPNADRLRLCKVDVGEGELRQIVCGASNFAQGDTVAVALPGATMPDGTVLGEAKLRGVESHGMMLSERELELSTDHSGIMVLPEEWTIGDRLSDHLPIADDLLELEITSNRPDCLSVFGIAREVSAAFDLELKDPHGYSAGDAVPSLASDDVSRTDGLRDVSEVVSVTIEASDHCSRYIARAFDNVVVGDSPPWLRARLATAGMRSINNVVDVTNYVMLLTGQPLHAFDGAQLKGGKIIVRRANPGEKVVTLDEVERTLDSDVLVIADAERTAVIAGIMGAADVEVSQTTTSIVLEAAAFFGPSILESSAKLGVRSESSSRFEKKLDPYSPAVAMRIASALLVELCGADQLSGTIDVVPNPLPALPTVQLPITLVDSVLGIDVPIKEVERILGLLGYSVASTHTGDDSYGRYVWDIEVPHWRMLDTGRPIDLVEEVGRIYGLDRIPSRLPARPMVGGLSRGQRMQRMLEDIVVGLGFVESVTYSLVTTGDSVRFDVPEADAVRVNNPMTNEHSEMRVSLLGSQLEVVRHNRANGVEDVAIFEMGRAFTRLPGDHQTKQGDLPVFANERRILGLCCSGTLWGARFDAKGIEADFASTCGVIEALVAGAGLKASFVHMDSAASYLHPGRAASVRVGETIIGWVGEVHPNLVRLSDIRGDVVAAEVDLDVLETVLPNVQLYSHVSMFPPVRQDIALIVGTDCAAGALLETTREVGGNLLEHVDVFDRYEGSPIPDGKYSLALRMRFRAPDRTLTDDEVAELRGAIVTALADRFGAELRDS